MDMDMDMDIDRRVGSEYCSQSACAMIVVLGVLPHKAALNAGPAFVVQGLVYCVYFVLVCLSRRCCPFGSGS